MITDSRESDYQYVMYFIELRRLTNAPKALQLMEGLIKDSSGLCKERLENDYRHSLYLSRMLLDLWLPFETYEKDLMLTAAICHTLTENTACVRDPYEAMRVCGIDEKACEILEMISGRHFLDEEGLKNYYRKIQQNRIALMIVLADRGSILQGLHQVSSWQARRHIYETRSYYFPMCIHAKEQFPELLQCISILMEKMRSLLELSEIMLNRYEAHETELMQDILALREENATIKGILAGLQNRDSDTIEDFYHSS